MSVVFWKLTDMVRSTSTTRSSTRRAPTSARILSRRSVGSTVGRWIPSVQRPTSTTPSSTRILVPSRRRSSRQSSTSDRDFLQRCGRRSCVKMRTHRRRSRSCFSGTTSAPQISHRPTFWLRRHSFLQALPTIRSADTSITSVAYVLYSSPTPKHMTTSSLQLASHPLLDLPLASINRP